MSSGVSAPQPPDEWDRLERAARRLIDEFVACRSTIEAREGRVAELERAMRDVAAGEIDPVALQQRLAAAEAENRALRARLQTAGERVESLLARLQFLQEER